MATKFDTPPKPYGADKLKDACRECSKGLPRFEISLMPSLGTKNERPNYTPNPDAPGSLRSASVDIPAAKQPQV